MTNRLPDDGRPRLAQRDDAEAARARPRFTVTIKRLLLSALICLAVLLVGAFGWQSARSWRAYTMASDIQGFDAGANRFATGLYEMLLERVYTNNGLQAADPASPATLNEIKARRDAIRQNYQPGLATLETLTFPNKIGLLSTLHAALDKATDIRGQADRALAQPREQRDELLRRSFYATMTDAISASLKLWFSALYHVAAGDPVLLRLATIKELGWQMRAVAGVERANIAQSIASGVPMSAAVLAANRALRAQVDILWQQLANVSSGDDVDPAILQARAAAQEAYFSDFARLADEMGKASAAGGHYSVSADQWVDATTPKIGALLNIMHAANAASESYTATLKQSSLQAFLISLALLIAALVAIGASATIVLKRVTLPLAALASVVARLAADHRAVDVVPYADRRDELGSVARAVEVFKRGIAEADRLRGEQEVAEQRAETEKRAALVGMADTIECYTSAALEQVSRHTNAMAATADAMAASSARTSVAAQGAASSSAQVLTNAQTVASAAEQLSASIREISTQVVQSTRVVGRAVTASTETRATIETLNEQVAHIGAVADIISEIAARTNLLALNATIEAARAGDAGKGFAVVASEVKALATQTAKSTQEIARHIGEVRTATGASVDAVARIGETIREVDMIANSIAAAVEQQGAATMEIARNVTETASAARDMTQRTQEVSAESERTGKDVAEVRENAAALDLAVADLRQAVVRVVRTSTTEVNRRQVVRHRDDSPCHVSVAGQAAQAARITDISRVGASIRGGPSLHPGSVGMLRLDGAGFDLRFIVRGRDGDALHVMFELDETSAGRLEAFLAHLGTSQAA
jgi:methyl-accepting chemotaxis protein